jgi:hypothetical protein
MSRTTRTAAVVAAVALATLAAGPVAAGSLPDHLECWKVRDTAKRASFTVDLLGADTPFPAATGCILKLPAKTLCHRVVKANVVPTPPGAKAGAPLTSELFACYRVKCPKGTATLTVQDQFGTRSMTATAPAEVCAPANVPNLPMPCGGTAPACNGTCATPGTSCGPDGSGGCLCAFG